MAILLRKNSNTMPNNSKNGKRLRLATTLTLAAGILLGVLCTVGFIWTIEATNSEAFCLICHEMKEYVYPEYKNSAHDLNRSGVRTTCADCNVPKGWIDKMVRKVKSSNEVYYSQLGTIETPKKYASRRPLLAEKC